MFLGDLLRVLIDHRAAYGLRTVCSAHGPLRLPATPASRACSRRSRGNEVLVEDGKAGRQRRDSERRLHGRRTCSKLTAASMFCDLPLLHRPQRIVEDARSGQEQRVDRGQHRGRMVKACGDFSLGDQKKDACPTRAPDLRDNDSGARIQRRSSLAGSARRGSRGELGISPAIPSRVRSGRFVIALQPLTRLSPCTAQPAERIVGIAEETVCCR